MAFAQTIVDTMCSKFVNELYVYYCIMNRYFNYDMAYKPTYKLLKVHC